MNLLRKLEQRVSRRSEEHSSLPPTTSTAPPPTSGSTMLPRKKAVPIQQCQENHEHFPGLDQRAYKVEQMLTRVEVVGIIGSGGTGKSTIVKQVFHNISSKFEYSCFVENAKDVPESNRGMGGWCDDIPGSLYHNGIQVDKSGQNWRLIWGKKILLIVDNIDLESQLNFLPHLYRFGNGSGFIITSHKRSILEDLGKYPYEVYNVDLLEDHEARKLLLRCAFGEGEDVQGETRHLEEYVERVVKKCHGVPLIVEVTGCSLRERHREIRAWEETIEMLGRAERIAEGPDERAQASLQVFVDCLPPEEREMFIDAGTFFFQQPLEEAMAAWSTAYQRSEISWENLLTRSLVKKISSEVWMDEPLRDLAKNMAKSQVICLSDEDADKAVGLLNTGTLNTHTVRTDAHSLRLSYNYVYNGGCVIEGAPEKLKFLMGLENDFVEEGKRPLQVQSLEKLEKLKHLELTNIPCTGTTNALPQNLSLLKWNLKSRVLPQISLQGLNDLAILKVHQATGPRGFSKPMGNLIKLRILSLRELHGLDCLPENFGNLSELQRLDLEGLDDLRTFPSSFGNLSALADLNLRRLGVVELPETFGDLSSLQTLSIGSCEGLSSLPSSFGRLSLLKKLDIDSCDGLEELPDSFGSLRALRDLRLSGCTSLEKLPDNFGGLSALESLELNWCTQLKSLPNSFGRLGALKRLTIAEAHELEQLSASLGDLAALTDLKLHSCPKLERLPESFGHLIT